jgi:diguanylate cyclase (GGDEF)-like protein
MSAATFDPIDPGPPPAGPPDARAASDAMRAAIAACAHRGAPLALLMVDVDDLRAFGIRHGRAAADAWLAAFAARLDAHRRPGDLVSRIRPDRIALALPDTALAVALDRAASLLEAIGELAVAHDGRALPRLGASIGVAELAADGGDGIALVEAAYRALYRAKACGGRQVRVAEGGATVVAPIAVPTPGGTAAGSGAAA